MHIDRWINLSVFQIFFFQYQDDGHGNDIECETKKKIIRKSFHF